MVTKIKRLTLEYYHKKAWGRVTEGFLVTKVMNSTELIPGHLLPESRVEELCASPDWHVTINRPRHH